MDSLPPRWLKDWNGDGIIARTVTARQGRMIQETHLPCVDVGHPQYDVTQMSGDFRLEAEKVLEHFLSRGFRHFAYFTYGGTTWIEPHRETVRKTFLERGYDCAVYHASNRKSALPTWDERQFPKVKEWLSGLPRPIGIITPGDLHAVQLLDICRQLDIAVPEEMAIIGRGNDSVICETVRPTLTSVDLNARVGGYEAARMLDMKMAGQKVPAIYVNPMSHIEVRQSTDIMVIGDADVLQAMRFIRDYACNGIDVPRVADEVGLSRRVLERRFLKYIGRTPKAEIMRIRIERAKKLLLQTDKFRENIAQKCGFASPEYFSKVFRRMVGMTPNSFRRTNRISRNSTGHVAE
jgi:LacI family transcriptional regulator